MTQARSSAILLLCGLCATSAVLLQAQRGPGSQFNRFPFDKWATENAKPQIRWDVRFDSPVLSEHQRLVTRVHATVDGAELQKRQGNGMMVVLVRIEDAAGLRFNTSNQTAISQLHKGDKFQQLDYTISAFILPGDYVVSLAICDAHTQEHSFLRRNLHIPTLRADPLPALWAGLPSVEFLPETGNPEAWYLPQVRSRITLPIKTPQPTRFELLVNTTPTELASINMFRADMQLLVPGLKVLTGIQPSSGSIGLSIVDLNRRMLTYQQPDLSTVNWNPVPSRGGPFRGGQPRGDWLNLRPAFAELSSATIDAKTLAGQRLMLDYFSAQATRLLAGPDSTSSPTAVRVLIVLSGPVFFTQQQKPPPPDTAPDPARRVFYICYSPIATVVPSSSNASPPAPMQRPLYPFTDDLERILKPMGARTFRVSRSDEFRKALAAILAEIAGMQPGR